MLFLLLVVLSDLLFLARLINPPKDGGKRVGQGEGGTRESKGGPSASIQGILQPSFFWTGAQAHHTYS